VRSGLCHPVACRFEKKWRVKRAYLAEPPSGADGPQSRLFELFPAFSAVGRRSPGAFGRWLLVRPVEANSLRQRIPNRSQIDHLLAVIRDDLSATAYVNELNAVAQVKLRRTINKGFQFCQIHVV
jgi:hypothetical protein